MRRTGALLLALVLLAGCTGAAGARPRPSPAARRRTPRRQWPDACARGHRRRAPGPGRPDRHRLRDRARPRLGVRLRRGRSALGRDGGLRRRRHRCRLPGRLGGATPVKVIADLHTPLGLVWSDGTLYVASAGRVDAYRGLTAAAFARHTTVLALPSGVGEVNGLVCHRTGGSSSASRRRAMLACHDRGTPRPSSRSSPTDATSRSSRAGSGPRSAWPTTRGTDDLFVSMNQRDDLGDATPGDWLAIVRSGQDWGFPDCYGQGGSVCDGVPSPRGRAGRARGGERRRDRDRAARRHGRARGAGRRVVDGDGPAGRSRIRRGERTPGRDALPDGADQADARSPSRPMGRSWSATGGPARSTGSQQPEPVAGARAAPASRSPRARCSAGRRCAAGGVGRLAVAIAGGGHRPGADRDLDPVLGLERVMEGIVPHRRRRPGRGSAAIDPSIDRAPAPPPRARRRRRSRPATASAWLAAMHGRPAAAIGRGARPSSRSRRGGSGSAVGSAVPIQSNSSRKRDRSGSAAFAPWDTTSGWIRSRRSSRTHRKAAALRRAQPLVAVAGQYAAPSASRSSGTMPGAWAPSTSVSMPRASARDELVDREDQRRSGW